MILKPLKPVPKINNISLLHNHRYLIQLSLIICVMLSDVKHLHMYLYLRRPKQKHVEVKWSILKKYPFTTDFVIVRFLEFPKVRYVAYTKQVRWEN